MSYQGSTRFANFGFYRSTLVIAVLIATVFFGLIVYQPTVTDTEKGKRNDTDLVFYQRVVEQIHAGSGYYEAAANEMHRMRYPTRSVFNWRLPALYWMLGHLPSIKTGQVLAIILTMMNLLIWMTVFHQNRYTLWQVVFGCLIMYCPIINGLVLAPIMFHEFWAGTLIALSLAAHARGWCYVSLISGLTALFIRELSLPFVCVMMVLSYMEGRRWEVLIWFLGILAFGGELLFHWSIVSKLVTENDLALPGGWIAFGGWPFVLHTAQMNAYILSAPPWIPAILLPFTLLGFAGWSGSFGIRVACTVGIYVLAFSIVGRSFNYYWGLMYAFIMPLGLLHAPAALRDLWQPIYAKLK